MIDELLAITKSIDNLYNLLMKYEMLGDGYRFYEHLDYLKIAIEVETAKYNQLSDTEKEVISKYIVDKKLATSNIVLELFQRNTSSVDDSVFYNRIMHKLHRNDITELDLEELPIVFSTINQAKINENMRIINVHMNRFVNEFADTFIMTIKDYLVESKALILTLKYAIAFHNTVTERKLLTNNFSLDDYQPTTYGDDSEYLLYKWVSSYGLAIRRVVTLSNCEDSILDDKDAKESLLLDKILLITALNMISLGEMEEIEEKFQQRNADNRNQLMISYIQDIFDNVKRQKLMAMQRNIK